LKIGLKQMTNFNALEKLQEYKKDFYTIRDLQNIYNVPITSLRVQLSRWCKQGIFIRLSKGIYTPYNAEIKVDKVANQIYYPSYLSFESALSYYGILSQIPYTLTFATQKKSKKLVLKDTQIEYTQLTKRLFFGYVLENGIYLATPEKALMDMIYVVSKGSRTLTVEELYLNNIDKEKFKEISLKFPKNTSDIVEKVIESI
jgi:predicted transcriptional regulator of viral defense system